MLKNYCRSIEEFIQHLFHWLHIWNSSDKQTIWEKYRNNDGNNSLKNVKGEGGKRWLPVLLHFTRSKVRAHFETSTCARERPKNNSNRSLRSQDTKCWMPFHWKHSCTKHSSWSSSNSDAHDKPTRRPNDETYFQLNTKLSTFPKISTSSFQSSIFFIFFFFLFLLLFFFHSSRRLINETVDCRAI